MRIAILSDIHDHLWNLDVALRSVDNCDCMICCGDLCSPFVVDELARAFPRDIHIVFGNNDADLFRITAKTRTYANIRLHGEFCELAFAKKTFAVNHFDYIARPIAKSGQYDVVCFGHNHQREITRYERTLALNPGPILGLNFQNGREECDPSFLIYDTSSATPHAFRIDKHSQRATEIE